MTSPDPSPVQASAETVKLVEELREASFSTGANAEDEHGFLGSYEKALARSERAESALLAHVAGLEHAAKAVLADYDERVRIYADREQQPHRVEVMEALREILAPAPERKAE